eukprot:gene455-6866_t
MVIYNKKYSQKKPDLLFLGTAENFLYSFVFEKEKHEESGQTNIKVKSTKKQYLGKTKKLTAIESDVHIGVLFVQHNSFIYMYDMETLQEITKIKESKGVSKFTLDKKQKFHQTRLIMTVNKKLITVLYTNSSYQKFEEFPLTESPLCMRCIGDTVFLGMKKQYLMLKLDEKQTIEVFQVESGDTPAMEVIEDEEEVLLKMGNVGVYVHMSGEKKGQPSTRTSVGWAEIPSQIAISFPFIIGLNSNLIEVYDMYSELLIMNLAFQDVNLICGDKKTLFITIKEKVVLLNPISLERQMNFLIASGKCAESLELLDKIFEGTKEEKEKLRSKMILDASFYCLLNSEFENSFDYFRQTDSTFDLRELLVYFDDLKPTNYIPKREYTVSLKSQYTTSLRNNNRPNVNETVKEIEEEIKLHMIAFLFERRNTMKITKEQQAIDAAILKILVELDDEIAIKEFLLNKNNINMTMAQEILQKKHHYFFYSQFQRGQGFMDKSLEILEKIHNKIYVEEIERNYKHEIIQMLKETNDFSLIQKYSPIVLTENPIEGITIFTKRKQSIDEEKVIKYLSTLSNIDIAIQEFLEHLILHGNKNPKNHTLLATYYIDSISRKSKRPGTEGGLIGKTRSKLLIHLSNSLYCEHEEILNRLKDTEFLEEQVIVHSKLNNYKDALKLILIDLDNNEEAEKFCLNQFPKVKPDDYFNNSKRSDLFVTALRICIETGDPRKLKFSIYLLNKYHNYISPVKVLKIIPSYVPMSYISHYLVQSLRTFQNVERNSKIFEELSLVEKWQIADDLSELQSRKVILKDSTKCSECDKVIGTSVFAVFPDLKITHLYCMDKRKKKENMK